MKLGPIAALLGGGLGGVLGGMGGYGLGGISPLLAILLAHKHHNNNNDQGGPPADPGPINVTANPIMRPMAPPQTTQALPPIPLGGGNPASPFSKVIPFGPGSQNPYGYARY